MYHLAEKMVDQIPDSPARRSRKGGKDQDEHHGEHEKGVLGEGPLFSS